MCISYIYCISCTSQVCTLDILINVLGFVLLFSFSGESVDDCGGGYSESIAEMCEELQNALTPLLIVTPNGRDESGANRDCFLLNPAAKSPLHMSMFRFLGIIPLISQSGLLWCYSKTNKNRKYACFFFKMHIYFMCFFATDKTPGLHC